MEAILEAKELRIKQDKCIELMQEGIKEMNGNKIRTYCYIYRLLAEKIIKVLNHK